MFLAWVFSSSAVLANLIPPADLHLGFHDDRVAHPLGLRDRFLHRIGHPPRRDRNAEAGKVLLALVLEQVHDKQY